MRFSQTCAPGILPHSRPRRLESALGALPGRKAAKLGKLTQHGHLTKIVTASMASARAFSHDQDPKRT